MIRFSEKEQIVLTVPWYEEWRLEREIWAAAGQQEQIHLSRGEWCWGWEALISEKAVTQNSSTPCTLPKSKDEWNTPQMVLEKLGWNKLSVAIRESLLTYLFPPDYTALEVTGPPSPAARTPMPKAAIVFLGCSASQAHFALWLFVLLSFMYWLYFAPTLSISPFHIITSKENKFYALCDSSVLRGR